jgi:hypothetical protein
VTYQLRMYTVKPGEMEDWLREWRDRIVPLRQRYGFHLMGAWQIEAENKFVWMIRHGGSQSFEEADRAYYASAERKAIQPDPARHLASTQTWLMESVQTGAQAAG